MFYQIAGVTVEMESFGRTVQQAESYRICDEKVIKPDILIQSNWKRLQERQLHLSVEDCEYLSTGESFYRQLLNYDGLLLHSSAVVMDNRAYLFSAPCGTGKSTHTALWKKAFGEDCVYILNDDKPALRFENGVWYAYGTPWSGKTNQNVNARVPIGGICFIRQGAQNHIERFEGSNAVFSLLDQTARPRDTKLRMRLMSLLNELIKQVPIWQMECNMETEAAIVSYEAMSNGCRMERSM